MPWIIPMRNRKQKFLETLQPYTLEPETLNRVNLADLTQSWRLFGVGQRLRVVAFVVQGTSLQKTRFRVEGARLRSHARGPWRNRKYSAFGS